MALSISDFLPLQTDYEFRSFPFIRRYENQIDFTRHPDELFDHKISVLLVVNSRFDTYRREDLNEFGVWKKIGSTQLIGKEDSISVLGKKKILRFYQRNGERDDKKGWIIEEYSFGFRGPQALIKVQLMNVNETGLLLLKHGHPSHRTPLELLRRDQAYLTRLSQFDRKDPTYLFNSSIYQSDPRNFVDGTCVFAIQEEIDARRYDSTVGYWKLIDRHCFIKSEIAVGANMGFKRVLEFVPVRDDFGNDKWMIEEFRFRGNTPRKGILLCLIRRLTSPQFYSFFDEYYGNQASLCVQFRTF